MALNKLISADSHVIEPPDVWTERMDTEFRDRAPRLVWTGTTHTWFLDGDTPAGPGGEVLSEAGKRYDDPDSMSIDSSFEGVRRGAYDPHARLKDLEVDGVVGEVVIPTVPTRFYSLPLDSEFLSACFRTMNDWMADFCRPYPDVLKGLGLINVDDVEDGVREYDRCLDMGLESVLVTSFPGEEKNVLPAGVPPAVGESAGNRKTPGHAYDNTTLRAWQPTDRFCQNGVCGAGSGIGVRPGRLGSAVNFRHDFRPSIRTLSGGQAGAG